MTVGSTIGIKTILVCPGKNKYPELHEKIDKKQALLHDDALPASVQEEIVLELKGLRAVIQTVGRDINSEAGPVNQQSSHPVSSS